MGIVRHVEHTNLEGQSASRGEVYTPFNQIAVERLPRFVRRVNLLVRTTVDPLSLAQPVRDQISALDKDQAVFNVRTMEQALARSVAARRFSMILLIGVCGARVDPGGSRNLRRHFLLGGATHTRSREFAWRSARKRLTCSSSSYVMV